MIVRDACPACGSTRFKKNGRTHNGKQNHQCKTCPRQFVQCAGQYCISDETRALIEHLLLERPSLRGICRAVGVGLKWLLGFLVQCFEALPDHLHVQPITCTREVMIQYLYEGVIPAAQHKAINKLARRTNHVERFNNTLRQRASRLVRETLSFSKKLAHHIGAIKYFICHYNLTRATA